MPTPITMPQLGESVTEGVVARWLKAEGDRVERDESLLEIVTDKVNAEMPSPVAGTLVKILAPEGATIVVGGEIAQIDVEGAVPAGVVASAPSDTPTATAVGTAAAVAGVDGGAATDTRADAAGTVGTNGTNGANGTNGTNGTNGASSADDAIGTDEEHRRYSPVVKRLAQEHSVDLSQVGGTGLSGRVTKDDVLSYIARRQPPAPAAPPEPAAPAAPTPLLPAAPPPATLTGSADEEYLPLTPMRRAIAEHMVRSKHTAPHATTTIEADMTRLVRWREHSRAEVRARHGVDITYVALVMQALVDALRAFPLMNASWGEDRIILKRRVNVGVAVGLDEGLVVPVVRDADEKSIVGLARAVADLTERARAGRLTARDMQGGTFTLNNTGVFGAIVTTPVINQPQAAILAMNAIVKRPVVIADDAIAVRSIMTLSLSFDHRIVDGLTAGRFMQRVVHNIDRLDPSSL